MNEKTYNIGVEATMEIIGGKWKPVILCHLRNQPLRSSELLQNIPKISQKVLTQQLRELEADGIINRKIYQEIPPRVEYSLSEYGQSLNKILNLLCLWVKIISTAANQLGNRSMSCIVIKLIQSTKKERCRLRVATEH